MTRFLCSIAPAAAIVILLVGGCAVGPKYHQPAVPVPDAFKEPLPAGWKQAEPSDGQIKGKWWEIYKDEQLNALEDQVAILNQNVLLAEAQYREAKEAVRIARAGLFPTVTTASSITVSQPARGYVSAGGTGPFAYQWCVNGTNIAGATGNSLNLTGVQFTNAGIYSVIVSNAGGSVTSSPAIVNVAPKLVGQLSGSNLRLTWPAPFVWCWPRARATVFPSRPVRPTCTSMPCDAGKMWGKLSSLPAGWKACPTTSAALRR